MKNINSSLKNIYLSNDFLFEPMKFNNYLNKKILSKSKENFTNKKNNNSVRKKKFKENKKRDINKNNNYVNYD